MILRQNNRFIELTDIDLCNGSDEKYFLSLKITDFKVRQDMVDHATLIFYRDENSGLLTTFKNTMDYSHADIDSICGGEYFYIRVLSQPKLQVV